MIEVLAKLDMIKIIGMSYLIFSWWRKILSLGLGILVDEVCHVKGIVGIPRNYIHSFFLIFQITFHDVVNQTCENLERQKNLMNLNSFQNSVLQINTVIVMLQNISIIKNRYKFYVFSHFIIIFRTDENYLKIIYLFNTLSLIIFYVHNVRRFTFNGV
jgi:hypothetical protein